MGGLSSREKRVVRGGVILAAAFALLQFVVLPAHDRGRDLERALAAEQQSLARIHELRAEYLKLSPALSGEALAAAAAEKGFSLFSFLDQQAAKSGIKGNIDYMKPHVREIEGSGFAVSLVKLKLKKAVYRQVVGFLKEVEGSGRDICITSLTLARSGRTDKFLDATMEVRVLVPKEAG